jgi:hypothetical protein
VGGGETRELYAFIAVRMKASSVTLKPSAQKKVQRNSVCVCSCKQCLPDLFRFTTSHGSDETLQRSFMNHELKTVTDALWCKCPRFKFWWDGVVPHQFAYFNEKSSYQTRQQTTQDRIRAYSYSRLTRHSWSRGSFWHDHVPRMSTASRHRELVNGLWENNSMEESFLGG